MQTIQIQVKDSYFEKFLNLLQALPQDEIKIIDKQFEDDKKMLHKVLDDYKSGKDEFVPYEEGMKEMDAWLDTLVENENNQR